jgi:hypothetical protein
MSKDASPKRRGRPKRTDIDTGKVCQDYQDKSIPVTKILADHAIDAMLLYRILDEAGVARRESAA